MVKKGSESGQSKKGFGREEKKCIHLKGCMGIILSAFQYVRIREFLVNMRVYLLA